MSTDYGKVFETARARIYHLLKDGQWHLWRELKKIGGVRYSARILELKREGYRIESRPSGDSEGKSYRMPTTARGKPQGKQVKVFLDEDDADAIVHTGVVPHEAALAIEDALASFRHNKGKL